MPFRFSFRVHPTAITVPYASMTDHIRRNCGFVDLRGRPDKAKDIAEASDSPALQQLLVHVAKVGSAIFELGAHQEPTNVPLRRAKMACRPGNWHSLLKGLPLGVSVGSYRHAGSWRLPERRL
jgi:hypothetical protein